MGLGKWGIHPIFQFATEKRWPFRDIAELGCVCLIGRMRLKHKLQAVALLLFTITSGNAQLWVGSDNFNSASLDLGKWSYYSGTLPLNLSGNFDKTSTGISFHSNLSTGESWGLIFWKEKLPFNANWSATVQASINPSFATASTSKYVETVMTVAQDLNSFSNYFTQCLHRDTAFDIVPNWATNGGSNTEVMIPTSSSSVVLKMDFDSAAKTISASYADINTPNTFTLNKTFDVSAWSGSGDFYMAIGGYSWDSTISTGLLNMDNFIVIPEPSAVSLLAVGLGGLAMMRRRRS